MTSSESSDQGPLCWSNTAWGGNQSPELHLQNLASTAQSLAVTMVDWDIPFYKPYPHWLIWNLPVQDTIAANIPPQATKTPASGALQGIAYGKHQYRDPKIPFYFP
ncbi:YbhB/YbcL family Raf kinase inhibitor-like protein [Bombilactobacillus apium]|uniref:hypothetical protein n=1 Tax=Bombilactobacillus apium TaxID=2675299 RepID=UPI002B4B147B|nr:hypothetical protein [Bombilactobacillus apium]